MAYIYDSDFRDVLIASTSTVFWWSWRQVRAAVFTESYWMETSTWIPCWFWQGISVIAHMSDLGSSWFSSQLARWAAVWLHAEVSSISSS